MCNKSKLFFLKNASPRVHIPHSLYPPPPCPTSPPPDSGSPLARAKWNKGAGSHTLSAPAVPLSGPSATSLHRGILHSVNRPICTNCCKNRPGLRPSAEICPRAPIKGRSVPIDVGSFVLRLARGAGTRVWMRSGDSCHRLIPKSLAARRHVRSGLRGAPSVFI